MSTGQSNPKKDETKFEANAESLKKRAALSFAGALLFPCVVFYILCLVINKYVPSSGITQIVLILLILAFIGAAVYLLIGKLDRLVLNPLSKLTSNVKELSAGKTHSIDSCCTSIELSALADAIISLNSGLNENLSNLEHINRELKKFESAFNASKDGILIYDADGVVIYANEAFAEAVQYNEGEILGKKTNASELLFNATPTEKVEEISASLKKGIPFFGEIKLLTKNAELSFDDITASPILDDDGNLKYVSVIKRNINDKKKYEEVLEHLASHDSLTLLPNRRKFISIFNDKIAKCRKSGERIAVLFFDLNSFRAVNDSLGHARGDQLLEMISSNLKTALTGSFCLARMGGDEFTALFEIDDSRTDLSPFAEMVFSALKKPFVIRNREFLITAAVGSSVYPDDGSNSEVLLRNADEAMYKAKEAGNNAYRAYDKSFSSIAEEKTDYENALRLGIENKELVVHFQPKMETQSKYIFGCEALVRWDSKTGLVSPLDFIPLAVESGLIIPLTRFVLTEACAGNQALVEKGHSSTVAVNIPSIVLQHEEFFGMLDDALEKSGMDAKYLDLEITESALISDSAYIKKILNQLRQKGVSISIDNFGTGFSSLSYLNKYPISRIKIDYSFIKGVPNHSESCAIVQAVVIMCKGLQLLTTAEGVETIEQMEFLEELDCSEIQGYYVGKAMPFRDYEKFMNNWNRMVKD